MYCCFYFCQIQRKSFSSTALSGTTVFLSFYIYRSIVLSIIISKAEICIHINIDILPEDLACSLFLVMKHPKQFSLQFAVWLCWDESQIQCPTSMITTRIEIAFCTATNQLSYFCVIKAWLSYASWEENCNCLQPQKCFFFLKGK